MLLAGADVLLYPTAIGSEPENAALDTRDLWQRAMLGHAVCNVAPVVAANRVGNEGGQVFYGSSFVANQRGEKLAELGRDEEGVAVATIDLAAGPPGPRLVGLLPRPAARPLRARSRRATDRAERLRAQPGTSRRPISVASGSAFSTEDHVTWTGRPGA